MHSENALFLTYDGLTDPLGQSQILPYIIGISNGGYAFTIISFEKKEKAHLIPEISAQCAANDISWIRLSFTRTPRYLSKVYDLFRFFLATKKALKKGDFKVVHCRSYQSAYLANKLKPRFNFTTIFDMRGFWIDERVEGGIWNLKNPLFSWLFTKLKGIEKSLILNSDYVISLTHKAARTINTELFPRHQREIKVIPCCADLKLFNPDTISSSQVEQRRKLLSIEQNQFVLGYLGAIGSWYLLPRMVAFFAKILERKKDAVFLFITQESQELIRAEFEAQGVSLEHLRVFKATRQDVAICVSLFNWLVFFTAPSFSHLARSPVKQGEAMSLGVPVICNRGIGDSEEIIKEYHSGIVLKDLEDETLSSMSDEVLRKKVDRKKIINGAKNYFDLENGIKKYIAVYEEIFDRSTDKTIAEM